MTTRTLLALALFSLMAVSNVFAQEKKDDPSRWKPADILKTESMGSVSFSPDKTKIVWTKRKQVKKKDSYVSDIYVTLLNSKKDGIFRTIQLTNGDDNDYSPIFSKDGEWVYFLSSREKSNKLWKISLYGGEVQKVHEFKNGISGLQWKDEHNLLFRSSAGKSLYKQELEKLKDNVLVVEDSVHWRNSHVFAFNLKDKSITQLTDNKKPLASYMTSPDGKWLFYSMQRSRSYGSDGQKDPFYYLKNLQTGAVNQIVRDRGYPIFNIQFSKDNKGFYFSSTHGSDPEWNGAGISKLFYYSIADDVYTEVDLKWEFGAGGGYRVVGNDVMVALSNKTYFKLAYYQKKGMKWSRSELDFGSKNDHVGINAVSEDGSKIVYAYSTSSKLPGYYLGDLVKKKVSNEVELVKLNKGLSKRSITKSEVITWIGYRGEEVTGLLYYPENYEAGKKYPLMLSIHGGPAAATIDRWSERWSTYPNLLAQKGMFVLKPNYHGSSNHGLSYVESIKGNYYEPELEDIMKGIALLDQQGKIDKSKLGTMGWSNGAIITTMLTVKYPDMFKVAAAGAGDVNWTSDFGTCGFGVKFDQSYFGGAPWDDKNGKFYNENYLIKSPLFEMEKVKTPTIIFHGSEDRAVPRDQGWEYYRALQQIGKAPVKFLWFPGQPHGLRKITHQMRKMKEEIAWIENYLLDIAPAKNEAFKNDSPLAALLKLQKASSTDGIYGLSVNGLLIPETVEVKKDSIALGRFEVTNAQFKAFQAAFKYATGQDNYPAVVSKKEAKEYVDWLAAKTGNVYRLPNKTEGEKLHKIARKSAPKANTLNHWAGYSLSKTDAVQLKNKLKEVKRSLLEEAGSRKSAKVGEAELYDIAGNVAEYFENGVYGFSAYDFFDVNNPEMIKSEKVGFRVVKE